jgi:zinc protease
MVAPSEGSIMHMALLHLLLSLLSCAPTATATRPGKAITSVQAYTFEGSYDLFGGLKVNAYRYNNGLQLLVVQDPSAPVIAYQTWYRVGSAMETDGATGLAHLFEHMMFKATEAYPAGHFDAALEAVGAEGTNAWTWLDETVYLEKVPKAGLATVIDLEATRMHRLIVDDAAFTTERDVVMNERRFRVDNDPLGLMSELLWDAAFDQHPYGLPTIGWMKDLESLTGEQARSFYEEWYAPNNATIVIVGDVTPDSAAGAVLKGYGQVQSSQVVVPEFPPEPPQTVQRRVVKRLPMASDRIDIGFRIPSYRSEDSPALAVLDAILTSGQAGFLKRALEDTGLASDVRSFLFPFYDGSLYEITVTAREGVTAEQLEGALFAELLRVSGSPLPQADVERGRNQVQARNWAMLADHSGKAEMLGLGVVVNDGDWTLVRDRLLNVENVNGEQVSKVLQKYLTMGNSTIVIGRGDAAPNPKIVAKKLPPPASSPALKARAKKGPPVEGKGQVAETTAHGAKIATLYDPTIPLVHLRVAFPRGSASDPKGKEGTASLTAKMLLRGTKTRPRRAFEEMVEQLGAEIDVHVDADSTVIEADAPADTWPALASLMYEALAQPAFAKVDLEDLKSEVDNDLVAGLDDDRSLGMTAFRQVVYGKDNPYGHMPEGRRSTIPKIQSADLTAFQTTQLRSEGALFLLAGAIDASAVDDLKLLASAVKGTPAAAPTFSDPAVMAVFPPPPAPPKPGAKKEEPKPKPLPRIVLVDKPERSQTQIYVGHAGFTGLEPTYPAFLISNHVFGGRSMSSKLWHEVREKRGLSYGAYADATPRLHRGTYGIWVFPSTDQTPETISLVLELVQNAAKTGITGVEFAAAREALQKQAVFLDATLEDRVDLLVGAFLTGYDPRKPIEAMKAVQLQDVNSAFQTSVSPDSMVIVLVGTESMLKDELAAIGNVEVVPYRSLVE